MQATSGGIAVDFLMFVFMVVPYVLAIRTVKQHTANSTNRKLLKQVDQSVLSVASRMMITISLLYIPYITITIMRNYLPLESSTRKNQVYLFAMSISYVLGLSNSFLNGIIFLTFSSKCRRGVLKMVKKRGAGRPVRFRVKEEKCHISTTAPTPSPLIPKLNQ